MESQEPCKSKRDEMLQLIVRPLVPKLPGVSTGSALFIHHTSGPAPLLAPIMPCTSGLFQVLTVLFWRALQQHQVVSSYVLKTPSPPPPITIIILLNNSENVAVGLWIWLEMINLAFSKSHQLICVALMSQNMQKVSTTVGGWNRFHSVSASFFAALCRCCCCCCQSPLTLDIKSHDLPKERSSTSWREDVHQGALLLRPVLKGANEATLQRLTDGLLTNVSTPAFVVKCTTCKWP